MRMHSIRESITQHTISGDVVKLATWLDNVKELRRLHGDDMVLYFEADSFVLFRISPSIIPNFVEQYYIEDNTEMSLKQWQECLENLIHLFNEDFYVFLVSNSGFNIRLFTLNKRCRLLFFLI